MTPPLPLALFQKGTRTHQNLIFAHIDYHSVLVRVCAALTTSPVCSRFCEFAQFHCSVSQGCINRSILPSGMGARGVSPEHVENMEMLSTEVFSGSPTQVRSGSWRTVLWFLENRALVLGEQCSISRSITKGVEGSGIMYHTDETRFYQTDDSKVTRRLLKEKSKLTQHSFR